MSAGQIQALGLAEQAEALSFAIERLPMSLDRAAISTHARQLAMMLRSQPAQLVDRQRLKLVTEDGVQGAEVITVDGSRKDIERLRARISHLVWVEQQAVALDRRDQTMPTSGT